VLESVTFTVKLEVVFGPVGVPEMTPLPLRLSPAGKLPLPTEYANAPAPPLTLRVCEYAVPSVPAGRVVVAKAGEAATVMLTVAVVLAEVTEVAVIFADPPGAAVGATYVTPVVV
jgi:hypothetical protein